MTFILKRKTRKVHVTRTSTCEISYDMNCGSRETFLKLNNHDNVIGVIFWLGLEKMYIKQQAFIRN